MTATPVDEGFLFAFPHVGQWCGRFSQSRPALLGASFATAAIVVPLGHGVRG
ncbi:hypothetical protein ACFX5Q_18070 [Mesorhizobium sp. IMUNJ 23033]|uniref:hypothetical protein n=1 Tax=Mesorhizobium sp. IMUNJ 23033 TaxID=3378039 RepID=UPI00384C3426